MEPAEETRRLAAERLACVWVRHMNLQQFCCDDGGRWSLRRPWKEYPFVIASDGLIAVRVDIHAAPDTPEPEGRVPKTDLIFAMHNKADSAKWQEVPGCESECQICNGTGHEKKECNTCYGIGCHKCDCGCTDEHDCGKCGGTGRVGTGKLCPVCCVEIDGAVFASGYIARVAGLPNVKCQVLDGERLLFEFDHGIGVLMALNDLYGYGSG